MILTQVSCCLAAQIDHTTLQQNCVTTTGMCQCDHHDVVVMYVFITAVFKHHSEIRIPLLHKRTQLHASVIVPSMTMGDSKDKQNCCLGLLYYSQALQAEGHKPVCLGVSHAPTERVELAKANRLGDQQGFRFFCLGNSLYEQTGKRSIGDASGDAGGPMQMLPYCEGLEVIVGSNVDAAAAAAATAGSSGRQPEEWSTVLSSMFGGEESPVVRGMSRFNKIASRNWERMKTTANQAYSTTVKPLVDRLSGDQQQ